MIRIGIVGCGRILAAHLRGYRLLRKAGVDDFKVTAMSSLYLDEARQYLQRPASGQGYAAVSDIPGDPLAVADAYVSDFQDVSGVKLYADYRELIAGGEVDAINDLTPHGLHHLVAAAAAEHGKDLLIQKPISVTVGAARRICDEFDARDLALGVFENWRYRARTRQARWLVDSGKLGAVQMLLLGSAGAWWAPDQIVAATPWRHRAAEAGGIALDMGVHQFHYVRYLAGDVLRVQGKTATLEPVRYTRGPDGAELARMDCDADDTFFASFDCASGATGNLFASWAGHGGATRIDPAPVVYGSRGRLAGGGVTLDGGAEAELAALYAAECPAGRQSREFPLGIQDEFALAQFEWLAAVRERRAPETSGREGLTDLACAFALLESSAQGRTIDVADVLSGEARGCQTAIAQRFGVPE